ncbi:MAG: hypothetical protein KDK70_24360, partial [Myxococcales bacterium]|nr:hypothetical protein [Myxococcales bacterium]
DKGSTLHSTAAARLYAPRLTAHRVAIAELPDPITDRNPLAKALAQADERFDAWNTAVWYYTESVLRAPDVTASDRAAARRIREAFVPSLAITQASYATEAAQAQQCRGRMPEHMDDLARFPIPGGSTLATWVEGFVSAGEELATLMAARSEQRALMGSRRDAGRLRMETIGLLTRLRAAIADEFADDATRLRTYETELFGFIDELAARREQSQRRRSTATGEATEADAALANAASANAAPADAPASAPSGEAPQGVALAS